MSQYRVAQELRHDRGRHYDKAQGVRRGARVRATIRSPKHATRRSVREVCAQAGPGCAPGAPNPVLTQCIVSESLFGTLFTRFFKTKKNLNKIK